MKPRGTLGGVMWYLHNDVVTQCPRRYGVDRFILSHVGGDSRTCNEVGKLKNSENPLNGRQKPQKGRIPLFLNCLLSRGIRRYFVTVKSTDALYAATARMFDRSLAAIEHCCGTAQRFSLILQLTALCLPKPHRITQTCRSRLRIF